MKTNEKIVVLIPAYNPTYDLIPIVNQLSNCNYKIIIVNDGSNSSSQDIFDTIKPKITLLNHSKNLGKGQALKTGFKYIKENYKSIGIVTADADGQHSFQDIQNVANTLLNNPTSVILGVRKEYLNMPFRSRLGNTITKNVFKLATGKKLLDTQTGLRAIPYIYIDSLIDIDGDRYEYEVNMLLKFTLENIQIVEVPINVIYIDRNHSSSFKIFSDSHKIYRCIFNKSRLHTIVLFTLSSFLAFIIDYVIVISLTHIFLSQNIVYDLALLLAVIFARTISSLFNFTFNRLIVFKAKGSLIRALVKYYLLATFILLINYLILDILAVKLQINLYIAKIIVETIMFLFSYTIQKKFISC